MCIQVYILWNDFTTSTKLIIKLKLISYAGLLSFIVDQVYLIWVLTYNLIIVKKTDE